MGGPDSAHTEVDMLSAENLNTTYHSAEICILGGGIAGITLAMELRKKHKVILVESGAVELDPAIHQECAGEMIYIDDQCNKFGTVHSYQKESRKRQLGGSSNCWANYTREMDKIDFEHRPWLPNSGWPFTKEHLRPYYDRSYEYAQVPRVVDDAPLFFNSQRVETQVYHAKQFPTLFASHIPELEACGVQVITHAHFTGFSMQGTSLAKRANFQTRNGKLFQVRANKFVMAMGGIENTRMLMHQRYEVGGLSAVSELGLFFMEHMHVDIGRIVLKTIKPGGLPDLDFSAPKPRSVALTLSPSTQRELKIVNGQIDLDEQPINDEYRAMGAVEGNYCARIRYIMGHAASPTSHLGLLEEKCGFGIRRVQVRNHFEEVIWRSMTAFTDILAEEVPGAIVKPHFSGPVNYTHLKERFYMFGSHHMGTTRMGSVVDENCKVVKTDNIYVAGSSVFNTVGHAAPTLTILAMSIRLADHIGGVNGAC